MSTRTSKYDASVELSGISNLINQGGSPQSGLAFSQDLASGELIGVLPLEEDRYACFFRAGQAEVTYEGTKVKSSSTRKNVVLLVSSTSGSSRIVQMDQDEDWVCFDATQPLGFLLVSRNGTPFMKTFIADRDNVRLINEEELPKATSSNGEKVIFDRGVSSSGNYVVVYGRGEDTSSLYAVRRRKLESSSSQVVWEFVTGGQVTGDGRAIRPQESVSGPVKVGHCVAGVIYRGREYLVLHKGESVELLQKNRYGVWEVRDSITPPGLDEAKTFSVEASLPSSSEAGEFFSLPAVYSRINANGLYENVWLKLVF